MTYATAPANWYSDPEVPGGLRYWDGGAWTWHRVPAPALPAYPYGGWGMPTWKGARLERPPHGPGSLADTREDDSVPVCSTCSCFSRSSRSSW